MEITVDGCALDDIPDDFRTGICRFRIYGVPAAKAPYVLGGLVTMAGWAFPAPS